MSADNARTCGGDRRREVDCDFVRAGPDKECRDTDMRTIPYRSVVGAQRLSAGHDPRYAKAAEIENHIRL